MDDKQLLETSKLHLQLVLGFFSRVESRSSVVLALDTGLLGSLAAKFPAQAGFRWSMWLAALVVAFTGISYWHLFRSAFPNLKGGESSLIFFGALARRKEADFIEAFSKQDSGAVARDLMSQTWRNSVILSEKFDHLEKAFVFLLLAVPPWVVAILLFTLAAKGAQTQTLVR